MKNLFTILLVVFPCLLKSQCKDIYGYNVDCPTENDSLTVYNNALKVYDFFENSPIYLKTSSREIVTDYDKRDVFDMLHQSRKMFHVIRQEVAKMKPSKFSAGKPASRYKDITYKQYYQEVDEYRFYQREMENQIINSDAPIPLYDNRICPIIVNEYKCIDSTSEYFGDLVNLPLYIPVVVKPYLLLTAAELNIRNEILHIIPPTLITRATNNDTNTLTTEKPIQKPKKEEVKRSMVKREYKVEYNGKKVTGYPVYAAYQYGGGALIGFLINGKFKKINPSEYTTYAVPPYAQKILENNEELGKMLMIKFGGYYTGLLEP